METGVVGNTSNVGLNSRDIETRPAVVGSVGKVELTPETKDDSVGGARNGGAGGVTDETTLGVGVDSDVGLGVGGDGNGQGERGTKETSEKTFLVALVPEDNIVVLGDLGSVESDGVVVLAQVALGDLNDVGAIGDSVVSAVGGSRARGGGGSTEAGSSGGLGAGGVSSGIHDGVGDMGGFLDSGGSSGGRSSRGSGAGGGRAGVGVLPGDSLAVNHGSDPVADSALMVLMAAFVTVGTGDSTAGSESRQQGDRVLELHFDVMICVCFVEDLSRRLRNRKSKRRWKAI